MPKFKVKLTKTIIIGSENAGNALECVEQLVGEYLYMGTTENSEEAFGVKIIDIGDTEISLEPLIKNRKQKEKMK